MTALTGRLNGRGQLEWQLLNGNFAACSLNGRFAAQSLEVLLAHSNCRMELEMAECKFKGRRGFERKQSEAMSERRGENLLHPRSQILMTKEEVAGPQLPT